MEYTKYAWLLFPDVRPAEVPQTCIHSNNQKGATPLTFNTSQVVWKSTQFWPFGIFLKSSLVSSLNHTLYTKMDLDTDMIHCFSITVNL